jgi:hypothetical protein
MEFLKKSVVVLFAFTFFSCENEVDLNAEFEDTTVVYALLNANADTQFVKINKAFLEDGANAIELAKDVDRLFYDSLDVRLISITNNDTIHLNTIDKPKEPGIFSNEKNVLFYTTDQIVSTANYKLSIIQPDGKETSATTRVLEEVTVSRPEVRNGERLSLSFTRISTGGLEYIDYEFIFNLRSTMASVTAKMYFQYYELINGARVFKRVEIPIGNLKNSELKNDLFSINYRGDRFYRAIANAVEPSATRKVVELQDNIILEVFAVDQVYQQYADINGPLDGLAQVRPEFTNITNGIGLFASRSIISDFTFLAAPSRQELLSGPITGNIGFVNP